MAKVGRPARPNRASRPIAYRPHVRAEAAIKAGAAKVGLSWAEYTEYVMCHALGIPECAPEPTITPEDDPQEVLPLTGN